MTKEDVESKIEYCEQMFRSLMHIHFWLKGFNSSNTINRLGHTQMGALESAIEDYSDEAEELKQSLKEMKNNEQAE